jgi:hypothetical protein
MSEKDDHIGFKAYMWQSRIVIPSDAIRASLEDSKIFFLNTDNIIMGKKPPDTRSQFRKLRDELKRRLNNACHALKGGYFD